MNTVVVLKGEKPAQTLGSDRSAVPLLRTSCEADVFTASTVCCKARVLVSRSVKLLLSTMARGFLFVRCYIICRSTLTFAQCLFVLVKQKLHECVQ